MFTIAQAKKRYITQSNGLEQEIEDMEKVIESFSDDPSKKLLNNRQAF